MTIILYTIISLVIYLFLRKLIARRFNLSGKFVHVNDTHINVEIIATIIIILVFSVVAFHIHDYDGYDLTFYGLLFFITGPGILFAIRAFIEWKLDKTTKRFLLSIVDSTYLIMFALAILFLS